MPEPRRSSDRSKAKRIVSLVIVAVFLCVGCAFLVIPKGPSLAASVEVPAKPENASVTPTPVPDAELVGGKCNDCHNNVVAPFQSEVHGKSAKFSKDHPDQNCESCHGNTEGHMKLVQAGEKVHPIPGKPVEFNAKGQVVRMDPEMINQSCMKCHSQDKHTFDYSGSAHDRKDMSCISCHSVHHSKSEQNMLARLTIEDTCLSCHTQIRKAVYQRSTHLIRSEQGNTNTKVGCTDCHNPHGGQGEKMLVAETVNNTCYQCHADKRGPFLWEHPPVRENCMSCHTPHGSNNPKLLYAQVSMSCQQCHIHMLPRHSTTAAKALDIWTLNRGCANCHSQVHGSNHPDGRTFTR